MHELSSSLAHLERVLVIITMRLATGSSAAAEFAFIELSHAIFDLGRIAELPVVDCTHALKDPSSKQAYSTQIRFPVENIFGCFSTRPTVGVE